MASPGRLALIQGQDTLLVAEDGCQRDPRSGGRLAGQCNHATNSLWAMDLDFSRARNLRQPATRILTSVFARCA